MHCAIGNRLRPCALAGLAAPTCLGCRRCSRCPCCRPCWPLGLCRWRGSGSWLRLRQLWLLRCHVRDTAPLHSCRAPLPHNQVASPAAWPLLRLLCATAGMRGAIGRQHPRRCFCHRAAAPVAACRGRRRPWLWPCCGGLSCCCPSCRSWHRRCCCCCCCCRGCCCCCGCSRGAWRPSQLCRAASGREVRGLLDPGWGPGSRRRTSCTARPGWRYCLATLPLHWPPREVLILGQV